MRRYVLQPPFYYLKHGILCFCLVIIFYLLYFYGLFFTTKIEFYENGKVTTTAFDRFLPLIFIGGMPRSGTTLMRAMLDAHPDIRCGQETRLIPRILSMRSQWEKSEKEHMRLNEAGLTSEVIDGAISAFILEIITQHGELALNFCNKDPFTMKSAVYLSKLFPNSKFIFMIRDGRATVHSIITRKITISGFKLNSFRQCLEKWNAVVELMFNQCREVGPNRCLPVYYEQLVLHPRKWMKQILYFLDIGWNENVLHHENQINKPKGVSLSKVERSSDQVVKPVNLEALTKWIGHIPTDVLNDIAQIAPMLSFLGYDIKSNVPNYGLPDEEVANNTIDLKKNADKWQQKIDNALKYTKKTH